MVIKLKYVSCTRGDRYEQNKSQDSLLLNIIECLIVTEVSGMMIKGVADAA